VRTKAVIRDKAIPYQVPVSQKLPARLGAVLQDVYLVFNEGYSAGTTGAELSREAIRLGRLFVDLLPEPEVMGLNVGAEQNRRIVLALSVLPPVAFCGCTDAITCST